MRTAPINKILPTSLVDGPGNRVAIFVQGCNLRCAYCHNPETQTLCIHCGACVPGCPSGALTKVDGKVVWNEALCINCDQCIAVCKFNASPKVKTMTTGEVYDKIMESVPFIRGITVSGGECSLYPEFLAELFARVKQKGLTCLLDSNGMTDFSHYPELMAVCDGVMLDVKAWDNEMHTKLTELGNDTVKKNLAFLAHEKKLAEIRVVYLKNEVDAMAILEGVAATIGQELCRTVSLRLTAFRHFGVRGRLADTVSPTSFEMQALYEKAKSLGFSNITVV